MVRTPARWNKAIQHLRERGLLEDSPRDIGLILREIPEDVLKEDAADISRRCCSSGDGAIFDGDWELVYRNFIKSNSSRKPLNMTRHNHEDLSVTYYYRIWAWEG